MSSEMICYNTRQHFWVPKIDYVRTEHSLKMEERSALNMFKRHREIWVKECARLGFRQQQPPYPPHFKKIFPSSVTDASQELWMKGMKAAALL